MEISTNSKPASSGTSWGKIILFLIGAVGALFGILFLYFKLKKQADELAKLQHEKDVTEEQKKEALANVAIAKNDDEAKKLKADAEQLRLKVADLNYQQEKIVAAQNVTKEKINAAKDWSDLDALFTKPSKPN